MFLRNQGFNQESWDWLWFLIIIIDYGSDEIWKDDSYIERAFKMAGISSPGWLTPA